MALTISATASWAVSPIVQCIKGNVTFDSQYATGGEQLDISAVSPQVLGVQLSTAAGYWFEVLSTNFGSGKLDLKAYQLPATSGAAVEVPVSTDLSAITVGVIITCKTQLGPNL